MDNEQLSGNQRIQMIMPPENPLEEKRPHEEEYYEEDDYPIYPEVA